MTPLRFFFFFPLKRSTNARRLQLKKPKKSSLTLGVCQSCRPLEGDRTLSMIKSVKSASFRPCPCLLQTRRIIFVLFPPFWCCSFSCSGCGFSLCTFLYSNHFHTARLFSLKPSSQARRRRLQCSLLYCRRSGIRKVEKERFSSGFVGTYLNCTSAENCVNLN